MLKGCLNWVFYKVIESNIFMVKNLRFMRMLLFFFRYKDIFSKKVV